MDNAQEFFDSLTNAAAVTSLVGRPEDLYFEAKTCSTPLSNDDKDNFAKALSGFANADGGVLVWGLQASGGDRNKPDVVTGVKPVSKLSAAHSELLSLVGQVIEPLLVENVQVVPRPMLRDEKMGFLLVNIPRSDTFLHRSRRDREYYRRHGHGFFRLEHYEIAEFYGRRKNPDLKIWWGINGQSSTGAKPNRIFTIAIVIGIENIGRAIAKHPAIVIRKSRCAPQSPFEESRLGLPRIFTSERDATMFGGGQAVIYPGTHLEVTVLNERAKSSRQARIARASISDTSFLPKMQSQSKERSK
jgi:hypothetical protein